MKKTEKNNFEKIKEKIGKETGYIIKNLNSKNAKKELEKFIYTMACCYNDCWMSMSYLDEITTMESEVELDDAICATIVVYELCARLLLTEDTALSNYFSSLASSLMNNTLEQFRAKAKQEAREDVYGSLCRAGD